ncbi:MAG: hypothetical protein P8J45_00775 [Phycisphaerales bacterium]|nr:hypothetical protein [Phycisphaerales bacterium]
MMLLIAVGLFAFDSREVMGINVWIKPMKFMASITIYLVTITWLIGYIERPRWSVRTMAWGISACMVVETTMIFLQAGRGVRSHFNDASAFDATVFAIMGIGVIVDALLMLLMLVLFFRRQKKLPDTYLWGIRFGILMFLAGGIAGGWMSSRGGHTVGSADGGQGLPLLNWSVTAGDLRIAHGLGLHGLQVMPILGYLLSRRWKSRLGPGASTTLLVTFGVLYGAMMLGMFLQAMAGVSIVSFWK